jgi:hypothetical protein
VLGNISRNWQKTRQTNFPTQKKEKIGPPGENLVLLIIKEENKMAGGTQDERLNFKILWTQDSGHEKNPSGLRSVARATST